MNLSTFLDWLDCAATQALWPASEFQIVTTLPKAKPESLGDVLSELLSEATTHAIITAARPHRAAMGSADPMAVSHDPVDDMVLT